MFSFTEDERGYLTEMRAITTNAQGQEILVGLTLEETAFYMCHTHQESTGKYNHGSNEQYLTLHDKHEAARHGILGAEIYLRNESPSLH